MVETQKHPEWRHAAEMFLAKNPKPGDIVTHDWLDANLDIDDSLIVDAESARRIDFLRLQRVEEFRKILLTDHRIYLENVRGKGYVVVAPENQSVVAERMILAEIMGTFRKAARVLEFVDVEKLTDAQVKARGDAQMRIASARTVNRQAYRHLAALPCSENKSSTPKGMPTIANGSGV